LTGVAPDFQVNHYLKGIYYTLNDNSQEKTKDVKKFEVHTFNSKRDEEAPKKIKRIKRTIKYIDSNAQTIINSRDITKSKLQQAQETLEKLRLKRQDMTSKTDDFKKNTDQDITPLIEKVEEQKIISNDPAVSAISRPRTLNAALNSQSVANSSLLGNISSKNVNTKPLAFSAQKRSDSSSLLSKIGQR